MNDIYVEYSTAKMPVPVRNRIFKNLLLTSGILFLIYSVLFYPMLWGLSLLFFVLAYYWNKHNNFEYEYILLNNELHVDRIVAGMKRKKAYRGDLNYMELFTNSPDVLNDYQYSEGRTLKKKRFNNPKNKTYALVLKTDRGLECLYLNGNEELVQSICKTHPQQSKMKAVVKSGQSVQGA